MYSVIRLIIGIALCGSLCTIIKKLRCAKKALFYVSSAILSILVIFVLNFFPVENFFVNFESVKNAYEYVNFGRSNIELIVEGNQSAFVVDKRNNSYIYDCTQVQ